MTRSDYAETFDLAPVTPRRKVGHYTNVCDAVEIELMNRLLRTGANISESQWIHECDRRVRAAIAQRRGRMPAVGSI